MQWLLALRLLSCYNKNVRTRWQKYIPNPAGCQVSEEAEELSFPGACAVSPTIQRKQQDFQGVGRAIIAFIRLPQQRKRFCHTVPDTMVRVEGRQRWSLSDLLLPGCPYGPPAAHIPGSHGG